MKAESTTANDEIRKMKEELAELKGIVYSALNILKINCDFYKIGCVFCTGSFEIFVLLPNVNFKKLV